ncbi:hypothetical protein EVAR_41509_1 [Eumeta japonica]|uniref:Uncharacterized protein n=1 Tax=Eumeta variegata TaxID=151549 RepID=A0A4C1X3Y6_EUMVA|nr:hypothetical protein EVAR_41509_1 [Eumeta japonica]
MSSCSAAIDESSKLIRLECRGAPAPFAAALFVHALKAFQTFNNLNKNCFVLAVFVYDDSRKEVLICGIQIIDTAPVAQWSGASFRNLMVLGSILTTRNPRITSQFRLNESIRFYASEITITHHGRYYHGGGKGL